MCFYSMCAFSKKDLRMHIIHLISGPLCHLFSIDWQPHMCIRLTHHIFALIKVDGTVCQSDFIHFSTYFIHRVALVASRGPKRRKSMRVSLLCILHHSLTKWEPPYSALKPRFQNFDLEDKKWDSHNTEQCTPRANAPCAVAGTHMQRGSLYLVCVCVWVYACLSVCLVARKLPMASAQHSCCRAH